MKNLPANAGDGRDTALVLRSGRSPRQGNGNPLQYSCLGNLMDRRDWQATVHGSRRGGRNRATEYMHVATCVRSWVTTYTRISKFYPLTGPRCNDIMVAMDASSI